MLARLKKSLILSLLFPLSLGFLTVDPIIYAANINNAASALNHEDLVDEVFIGDVVYPEEKNQLQLTLAPEYQSEYMEREGVIPIILEYGITDALQVQAQWNAYESATDFNRGTSYSGIGDVGVGIQYSFMYINHSNYSAAFGFQIEFPIADVNKDLTDGFMVYSPYAIVAKNLPSVFHSLVFVEVGVNFLSRQKKKLNGENEPEADEFFLNAVMIMPYKTLRGIVEMNWETNQWGNVGGESELYFTPGLIWHPNLPIEIGLGVPVGLTDSADRYQIIALFTINF